jgi:hypothetical protein
VIGVVLVRRGENPELRYAMRSWAHNVPQITDVLAVGMPPWWVGARIVQFAQLSSKYANTTRALQHVCTEQLVPDRFVLLNDDFFALRPTQVPAWHRGPMLDVVAAYRARGIDSPYVQGMEATALALTRDGIAQPLCYEVHAPMVVERDLMATVLETYTADSSIKVLHKRSAYGNLAGAGGTQVEDVKLRVLAETRDASMAGDPVWDGTLPDLDWISTSDAVWTAGAGPLIAGRFPTPSPWELPPSARPGRTGPGQIRYSA